MSGTNITFTQPGSNVVQNIRSLGESTFVDVTVGAANRYGDGPKSPVKRIFTNGMCI